MLFLSYVIFTVIIYHINFNMNHEYIVNLISLPLNKITFTEKYLWKKFKNVILDLQKKIILTNNINKFIEYYSLYSLIFNNYINYMDLINHNDINNINIYEIGDDFMCNDVLLTKLIEYKNNIIVQDIIKLINPFLLNNLNNSKKNITNIEHINNIKCYNELCNCENSYLKIANIIIYRYLYCKDKLINSYHDFYIKYYINDYKINNLQNIILQIPKFTTIFNNNNNNNNNNSNSNSKNNNELLNNLPQQKNEPNKIEYNIMHKIIKYMNLKFNYNLKLIKYLNLYVIKNNTNEIYIKKSNINKIIITHNNIQALNIPQLNKYNFNKNTNNIILVKFINITNYIQILHFIYNIVISIFMTEKKYTTLLELFSSNYIEYYYEIYTCYLLFMLDYPKQIQNNLIANILVNLCVYSYYDYYFYFNDKLSITLINCDDKNKKNIICDLCNHINDILPIIKNSLYNFPPFIDYDNVENEINEYSFNIPSYFKLYYLIIAINDVYKYNTIDINKIYLSISQNNNINVVDKLQTTNVDDKIKTTINIANDIKNIKKNNANVNKYYEFSDNGNNNNYVFDTEK